ncbi:hypothetical protein EBR66_07425 [bacterium]|nr:hypothetical protein [bacterium]
MLTLRNTLVFSIFVTIFFIAAMFSRFSGLCSEYSANCRDPYHNFALAIFWAPALLIFSLILLRLKEEVFNAWKIFSFPWIIVSTAIVSVAPVKESLQDSDWKSGLALITTAIFILVSIGIILVQWWKNKMR